MGFDAVNFYWPLEFQFKKNKNTEIKKSKGMRRRRRRRKAIIDVEDCRFFDSDHYPQYSLDPPVHLLHLSLPALPSFSVAQAYPHQMGGTGRSKRRKREVEHGTGLEHAGVNNLSTGAGQRDRVRRRRLSYKLEKQGKEVSENPELSALVARQKRQRKIVNQRSHQEKKHRSQQQLSDDGTPLEGDSDNQNGEEVTEKILETAPFSDENANWLKLKNKKVSKSAKRGPKVIIGVKKSKAGNKNAGKAEGEERVVCKANPNENTEVEEEESEQTLDEARTDEEGDYEEDLEEEEEDVDNKDGEGDSDVDAEAEEEHDQPSTNGDDMQEDSDQEMEDAEGGKAMFEDGEDDEDSDDDGDSPTDKLEIQSAKILEQRARDAADAEAEEADEHARPDAEFSNFKLDTGILGRGGQDGMETPATRDELTATINGILHVLSDFKSRREEGKSRSEYVEVLKQSLSECYGYNEELTEMLMEVFPNREVVDFMDASEKPRPLTIRTNTLKIKRRDLAQLLISRGMNVDPIDKWSKVGLVIYESQVPVGATPEYLAGYYMIQSASSFLPVVALAPRENEKVLDMAAAPGGKTSYIGSVMKNMGVLVANDAKRERIKSLVANLHRLGVSNSVVTNYDGRLLPKVFGGGGCFDRALLDAPCSGTGVICHDAGVKTNRDKDDVRDTAKLQKELLVAAIDCVSEKSKTGGYVVYSTCSVLVEENEDVIEYALRKRHVKIVDAGIAFGVSGFTKMGAKRYHKDMVHAKRIYPHVHNLDGFFLCKLKKMAAGEKGVRKKDESDDDEDDDDDEENNTKE